jgi:hypothetical protein
MLKRCSSKLVRSLIKLKSYSRSTVGRLRFDTSPGNVHDMKGSVTEILLSKYSGSCNEGDNPINLAIASIRGWQSGVEKEK